ncbi:MAG: hypothetical protein JWP12_2626 [Bacteroidetes bacterium]|nr:hypothetical protein [Bacteroidota bacterium]
MISGISFLVQSSRFKVQSWLCRRWKFLLIPFRSCHPGLDPGSHAGASVPLVLFIFRASRSYILQVIARCRKIKDTFGKHACMLLSNTVNIQIGILVLIGI